jgi:hypothetical protein
MAGNPTLTKVWMAGILVTFITATLFIAYLSFAQTNNAIIEEPYRSIFENISAQASVFTDIGESAKDEGLVRNIYRAGANLITGTVNVFVTGLDAMGKFFLMVPVFGSILSAIALGIPGLASLMVLVTLIVGVYIAMRYIQSVSNKPDLP